MTFTTAAASEMRDRIGAVAGKAAAKELMISTFHSFSLQLCRSHAEKQNSSGSDAGKDVVVADAIKAQPAAPVELNVVPVQARADDSSSSQVTEPKPKVGPSRCFTCCKRVGLTGFNCKCGDLFCSAHRYSDKHNCPLDYRTAGRDAIAKANPVIKAEKLDKI